METLTDLTTRTININGWQVKISRDAESVPSKLEDDLRYLLDRFNQNYHDEGAWIQDLGIPSVLVSVNCTYDEGLKVFSIDTDPKNLGIASVVNKDLKQKLQNVLQSWPRFVVTNDKSFKDDYLWTDKLIDKSEASGHKSKLILFRGKEIGKDMAGFSRQAASVLFKRNSNSYGVPLGLWKKIGYSDLEKLPWNSGFALKTMTASENPFNIYLPFKYGGAINEGRVTEKLSMQDMYLQEFIKPMKSQVTGEMMIYKVFFAYDFGKNMYDYLGGVWLSRDNYRIHGTPETTFGPITHY